MPFVAASPYKAVGRYSACGEYTTTGSIGAFTHKGYTVDYYADKGTLSFDDKNLRKLYEGMRNADIEFQKNIAFVVGQLRPIFGTVEMLSQGNIKAADLERAAKLQLPSWGVALVLEVVAGKRPADDAFRAYMRQCAEGMVTSRSIFAIVTGINAVAIGAAFAPTPAAPVFAGMLPLTGTLAGLAGTATGVTLVLEPIFKSLAEGKPLTRKQTKDMLEGAARVSGQDAPSTAQVNAVYLALEKDVKGKGWRGADAGSGAGLEAAKRAKAEAAAAAAAASSSSGTAAATAASSTSSSGKGPSFITKAEAPSKGAPTLTPSKADTGTDTGSNLLPIAAGVGVLALVGIMALRRK